MIQVSPEVLKLAHTSVVLSLFDENEGIVQVLSTQRPMSFMEEILHDLKNNAYKNRNIQLAYNKTKGMSLQFFILEEVSDLDSNNVLSPFCKTVLLRMKQLEWANKLKLDTRFKVEPVVNTLKCDVRIEQSKKYGIQVVINTARNMCYYVQQHFSTLEQAEKYVNSHSEYEMVKDTGLVDHPYRDVAMVQQVLLMETHT